VADLTLHTPETISEVEATISEDSSYYLHTNYESTFPFYTKYDNSKYSIDQILYLATQFSVFHSKVKLGGETPQSVTSRIPIEVFRYKRLEDGSWYSVKTAPSKHKEGDIVEGAFWSNGMFYIIKRNDSIIEAALYIDQYTKDYYKYP
jgi:predicted restriction endonuclease